MRVIGYRRLEEVRQSTHAACEADPVPSVPNIYLPTYVAPDEATDVGVPDNEIEQ